MSDRRYRAGDSIEDICRACKLDRMHTVVASDQDGRPIRVSCGYCGSEHNYRGGPARETRQPSGPPPAPRSVEGGSRSLKARSTDPFPLVSDRERTAPAMS